MLGAGRDVTQLFESYHSAEVYKLECFINYMALQNCQLMESSRFHRLSVLGLERFHMIRTYFS